MRSRGLFLLALMLALVPAAEGALTETQTFQLQPGWNAIFLNVQPDPPDPATVFASVPVDAVWMWNGRPPGIEFSRDTTEALVREPGWLGYFPASAPHSFLTTLFSIGANRGYLVRLGGGAPATLQITGRPVVGPFNWVADSYNLAGLPVDPASPPTFSTFFATSSAHNGQPVYTLDPNGTWRLVNRTAETIAAGRAYWIFTRGSSTFQGPISVALPQTDGLEFGKSVTQLDLVFTNSLPADATISAALLSSPTPVKLSYLEVGPTGENQWVPLSGTVTRTVRRNFPLSLRIAAMRENFTDARAESVLEVKSSAGERWAIPVGATRGDGVTPFVVRGRDASGLRRTTTGIPTSGDPFAGLWSGIASISRISQSQTGSMTPVPTASSFDLRLLLHVSGSSQVHLLKEVVQMFQEGTSNPDGTLNTAGRFVLVTDDAALSQFTGATLRDGIPVGKRLSTASFDFAGNRLPMTGTFATTGTLTATIDLPSTHPTNPFRHKFHPDHDNLTPLYAPLPSNARPEVYPVSRTITMMFSATDPTGVNPPGFGESFLGGVYRETITGLHRNPIVVEGTFRIARVSQIETLKP